MDMEVIVKLLNLTRSDSDGEALAAVRKANAMLAKLNSTWDEVVLNRSHRGGARREAPRREAPRREPPPKSESTKESAADFNGPTFERMCLSLGKTGKMNVKEEQLVNGFYQFYKTRGYLTLRQYEVFKDIYYRKFGL